MLARLQDRRRLRRRIDEAEREKFEAEGAAGDMPGGLGECGHTGAKLARQGLALAFAALSLPAPASCNRPRQPEAQFVDAGIPANEASVAARRRRDEGERLLFEGAGIVAPQRTKAAERHADPDGGTVVIGHRGLGRGLKVNGHANASKARLAAT